MKKSVLIFMTLFVCGLACGQEERTLMGKDEMEEFAEMINELVLAERYEEAVRLYEANRGVVNPKMLDRGDRGWWKETAEELDGKLALFNRNRERIRQAVGFYDAFEYRKSWDLTQGMKCDSTNTYREYVVRLKELRDSLEEKHRVMEEIDAGMAGYVERFRSGRYDELYMLLRMEHLLGYVAEEDKQEIAKILEALKVRIESDPVGVVMGGELKDRELIKSVCENDVSKLLFVMKLDVIHYYNMLFDTEGQIKRYKESAEYAAKVSELMKIREETLKRVYCQEVEVEMGEYDRTEGCFRIDIGSNTGTNLTYFNYATAAPQKAIGKRFEKVVHEALEVVSAKDKDAESRYTNGEKFQRHYMVVHMGEEKARKCENRRCRVMVCFVPAGAKEYSFTAVEFYSVKKMYDVFQVTDVFPYSVECRVIVFGDENEVVYDKKS